MKRIFYFFFLLVLCCVPAATGDAAKNLMPEAGAPPFPIPIEGPYTHSVHSASSSDGLNWQLDSQGAIVEHASVPTAIQTPEGIIRVYFVDASNADSHEKLGCVESLDAGKTYQRQNCEIRNMATNKAVDYCVVQIPDGRYRLYYYAVEGNHPDTPGVHYIESAISQDGIIFDYEGPVFYYDGLVDPDVFWNGKQWIMHVFSLALPGTIVATSLDGLSFKYHSVLPLTGFGVTKPITLPDGTLRMYGFRQPHSNFFESFISSNGFAWQKEMGERLKVSDEFHATDPYVILLSDGSYKMFFKLGPKRSPMHANA